MTDDNGLYYMRARYYNVNIKRFINQDVVHGSINVSQSLNRYSYVQGNPIKLTDPFGLSPLDRLNWKNLGHAILNGLGLIPVIGEAFDIANAIWYAHDGEYGMAVLSMMSALPMIGNIASGIMTAAKITTAAKIVSTACKVVSNAATFTQAAIGGVNNAKAIVKNMINGKLFSEDTAKNLVSFGINAFTAATSGKNLLSSSKELKKVVEDSAGSKWGKKAKKEPLLECNLQFFADKTSYGKSIENTEFFKENGGLDASDYISIHSRKHMYDPDTVSTPKKTQYGKDVNVGKLCEDTIMKPDEVIYNKDQNVMIYKKEYPFNISTSDTPTGTHRVFIPLNTQGKKTIRMSQFPLVGGN